MSEPLPSVSELAKMIDHSLLHPTMTDDDVIEGCRIAVRYQVATACVKPYAVEMAAELLQDSSVEVSTVAGFPHGNSTIEMKCREAEDVVNHGASEVDMVVNIGKVLGGNWEYVNREIGEVNKVVVKKGGILKVIFENDFLQDEHIIFFIIFPQYSNRYMLT